jgi:hypothetical protein
VNAGVFFRNAVCEANSWKKLAGSTFGRSAYVIVFDKLGKNAYFLCRLISGAIRWATSEAQDCCISREL